MDYKEKYEQALEKARELMDKGYDVLMPEIFPELQESEDEKVRLEIRNFIWEYPDKLPERTKWLAWFEKQGEQKPIDKPKFKVGDWIVFNGLILHIDEVVNGYYRTTSIGDGIHNSYDWNIDNAARLWTIQEAKDGNVLAYVTDEEDLWIMIYRSLYEPYEGHVHYHALLVNDNFSDKGTCFICIDNLKPASKEQRDLLFQKMKEAGYKWDSDKKELKKIEPKKVNADKVIEWLKGTIRETKEYLGEHGEYYDTHLTLPYDSIEDLINDFKEDFEL